MYTIFLKVFTLKTWTIVHRGDIMRANEDFFATDNSIQTFKSILLIDSVPRPKEPQCSVVNVVEWLVSTRPEKRGCLIWRKRVPQAQGAPAPVFFLPVSFLVLCHQPLTAALSSSFFASLLCHNRSPPLSHAVLVSRRKKERRHLALFVQALFVLISKVTTLRVVCHSDVCPLFWTLLF